VEAIRQAVEQHRAKHKADPHVVLVKGLGMFTIGDDLAAARTAQAIYTDAIKIMAGARRLGGGVNYMSADLRKFIEEWEVESYRKGIAAAGRAGGRAAGKVIVVTGAAQGFGLEISQDAASQGAYVVLTDINAEGTAKAAAALNEQLGKVRAIGVPINVTSGESVEEAIYQTIRVFGGVDCFISNAGVLKAGSVKTQTEKDFDFVTNVNYKGFFICTQKVAPILATQRAGKKDYFSDIIQINSKSGLQGSNRNGAYAGSKFGGIGLVQSFAMELVEDGVKVNAICPGNFFDGPLWSDPVNGLFAQYLKSGKVPGAKTIEDVKRSYESKVPMNRGCTTADVVKAIYYLMEQKYETGQAVPVTGGQVMLS
jgi:NAD(P)-dependent dehydrogenase (short-subunit alcohol dehydrogenase family)